MSYFKKLLTFITHFLVFLFFLIWAKWGSMNMVCSSCSVPYLGKVKEKNNKKIEV